MLSVSIYFNIEIPWCKSRIEIILIDSVSQVILKTLPEIEEKGIIQIERIKGKLLIASFSLMIPEDSDLKVQVLTTFFGLYFQSN